MDENQLRYQRLFHYTDDELIYKVYRVTLDYCTYTKKINIRACCKEEIKDTTKTKIKSIKQVQL